MISQKSHKRGRPKKKLEHESDSSQEFSKKKPTKKAQKAATLSRKHADTPKNNKRKAPTRRKAQILESSDSESQNSSDPKEQIAMRVVTIPLESFKPDKLFAQILNKANKQPEFLIMLRNLLSGSSRTLRDKKLFLKKKWELLGMSNCTQDEYHSRQSELKRMEVEEIYEIEKDIMHKLSYANVKGFQLKEALIEEFKHNLFNDLEAKGKDALEGQYVIDQQEWEKYHEQQKKLLNLLLNQKDFVYSATADLKNTQAFLSGREQKPRNETEIDMKLNNIETEQNPQTTQFLFCKHFIEINYDKVFENLINPFKLQSEDIYSMDAKALSWILETKSDEVYTNQKFQKQTYKRYSSMLAEIYSHSSEMNDEKLIEQLLEIAAYILNSVHYYQKFKLKCNLLHPLDLLLVIERIKKERRQKATQSALLQEKFARQMEGIAANLHVGQQFIR